MARRTMFSHNVEDVPYGRIAGVGHEKHWFRRAVTMRLPGAVLTIRKISKDDAIFVDHLVTGRRAGVVFETGRSSPAPFVVAAWESAAPWQTGYIAPPAAPAVLSAPGAGRNLSSMDPLAFEELVRQLLETMGYQARLTKASHDGGVDIEAYNPQPIVGGKIVVQCKRYSGVVGASYIRDLAGVVQHEGATKGILITTSHFSPDAQSFARGKPLELIDGPQLGALLDQHGLALPAVNPPTQLHIPMTITPIPMGGPIGAAMPSFRYVGGWRRSTVKTVSGVVVLVALTLVVAGLATPVWQCVALGSLLLFGVVLAANPWRLRSRTPILARMSAGKAAITYAAIGVAGYGLLASLSQGQVAPSPAAPPSAGRLASVAHGTGAAHPTSRPSLRVSPVRAIAGARVRLTGRGLAAHEVTRIYWVAGHRWQRIVQTRTGGHGVLNGITVHVPRAAAPGSYHIAAVQTVGGRGHPQRKQQAWASFVVLGARPRSAAHGAGR